MATLIGLRNVGLKSRIFSRQPLKLFLIPLRLMSDKKSGNATSGKTSNVQDTIKEDPTSYNVPEYYSYDKDTYANLEVEITQAGYRQSQPDPSVPYFHHCPWEKNAA